MKKLLAIFTLSIFASAAVAQVSVVTGSGKNDSSMGKSTYIINKTDSDLGIIKTKADKWNEDISNANTALESNKNDLNTVIESLTKKNDQYKISEVDPNTKSFSLKDVPTCYGAKPRLAYQSGNWVCKEPIKCSDLGGGMNDWVGDATTGKCLKPKATWETGNWTKCSGYTQSRSVRCRNQSSKTSKTYLHDDSCTGPKPATSRKC